MRKTHQTSSKKLLNKLLKSSFITLTFVYMFSMTVLANTPTFSEFWYQDTQGNWHIQDNNGNMVTNAWLCDDAVSSNGQNIWYLIDSNGNMVSAGLVQDQTGNIYSLETSHNGYYGMLRYQSGAYDGVYLDLESSHGGSFAKIKNQEGVAGLQGIYGLTQVNIDNSNCVYTSSFKNSYSSSIPNGTNEPKFKKEHPDDKVIVNGVDISQYILDEETAEKTAERNADKMHEGLKDAPALN